MHVCHVSLGFPYENRTNFGTVLYPLYLPFYLLSILSAILSAIHFICYPNIFYLFHYFSGIFWSNFCLSYFNLFVILKQHFKNSKKIIIHSASQNFYKLVFKIVKVYERKKLKIKWVKNALK